jgi:hypothetical protein
MDGLLDSMKYSNIRLYLFYQFPTKNNLKKQMKWKKMKKKKETDDQKKDYIGHGIHHSSLENL